MKIAVVGGGSTYTPELADGFARLGGDLGVDELTLIDPADDRLSVVGPLAERIFRHHGHGGRLTWTTDVDAGLDGATIVIIQLRVGGQTARISDETFPLSCGCLGQETTGAGGLAKALRTVPVVTQVAERARQRAAPGAWIVTFTNPVGIVTRALLDRGHRAVGLCNVAIGFQRRFAELLDVAADDVSLRHIGLNHLTWEQAAYVDGVDRLPELISGQAQTLATHVGLPASLVTALGRVPSYYLRYFYCHDEVVRDQRGATTRGEQVAQLEAELLRLYADPELTTKPPQLSQRGGAYYSEAAVGLVTSLLTGDGGEHAVNLRNAGVLPFLPANAVIETTCHVRKSGPEPVPVDPVGPELAGLIGAVSAYEELALDAAQRGGRSRVYAALLAHPLVGQHELAEALTDELIAANTTYLGWAR
ncbi:6-phospho-beta-glucosidase [Phytoactinopolyspora limicola]|uniref:6-phospho-beta-glucosidase n=1 Tax=Phytoactinopolyspora limicola TaxID=2715536 RepID=UPI00140C67C0|nr:6-phospho-beta-glucosidase [Phytoactinopolyspora limicola]